MLKQENYLQEMIVSLRTRLLVMAASVEIAVENTRKAVEGLDVGTAQSVMENDDDIDALEVEIDDSSLALLARAQPVAKDLRFVVSVLRMVVDMERIGDEAASICSQVVLMKDADKVQILDLVGDHMDAACRTFTRTMDIVRQSNYQAALELQCMDDEALQSEVATIGRLMAELECTREDKKHIDAVLVMHLILLVHSLTRIWRRSVNIAGHVYFASLGDSLKHLDRKKEPRLHF